MSIKYFIYGGNMLGKKTNIGKVTDLTDYSTKELVERMVQGKTGLGSADIEAFLKILKETVITICREGGNINIDGFMSFKPSMGGTFESESSSFDRSKNSVYIKARISSALNDEFQLDVEVEIVQSPDKRPVLSEIFDVETGGVNESITKNNIITIRGDNLKFDPDSTEEYLEIVNADNESETVRITKFQKVTDKEVVFLCPSLTYTNVFFEIGALMGTKTLKNGESDTVSVN